MLTRVLLWLVIGYRIFISPFLGQNCRFMPTCSSYARQALLRYGALKGVQLIFKRLIRCHPYRGGAGYDPLP